MDQMKMLGYKTRNVVQNLGSISIFWFLYWCKILILVGMKIIKIKKKEFVEKSELFKKIYNILFS